MIAQYPRRICGLCGAKHGRSRPANGTWSMGPCDICGETKLVTDPATYHHLKDCWIAAAMANGRKS